MTSGADPTSEPAPSSPEAPRRFYLWAAAALVVLSLGAIWIASRADPSETIAAVDVRNLPVGRPAPELHAKGWLNSPPLTARELAGKVVLYDFWTYSCVNCLRTLPHLRSWHDRYRDDGLVIVGVHSPEFDFEKNHGNVAQAVSRLGVTWPVALDDDMAIWGNFDNRYWPTKWVTDRQGRIRYVRPGEGGYAETESVIRTLLGVSESSSRAEDTGGPGPPPAVVAQSITQETYLGTERGDVAEDGERAYTPGEVRLHQPVLVGTWAGEAQRIRSVSPDASLTLRYLAREVNVVLAAGGPGAGPIDVTVELDGEPLPERYRTGAIDVDASGATYVRVEASDMYRLVFGPRIEEHTLRLVPRAPGLEAFAITFGA